jgi:long-chain acyl-CoA synthetase
VHVSTCYVCGEADGLIEETEALLGFYPRRKGPEDKSFEHTEELRHCRERIRQICESAPLSGPGRSKEVAQRLVALGKQRADYWGWVNTYTYAKSLGEQIIAAEKGLDYAIVRPAIVESALRFPFPGWIEGGRTAAPLVLMALGGLKDWPMRKDTPLEVVPVDLVASAILVVSALLLHGEHRPVYQLGTADVNPILLERLVTLLDAESRRRRRQNGHRGAGQAFVGRFVGAKLPWARKPVQFVSAEEARTRRRRLQKRISQTEVLLARMGKALESAGLPGRQSLAGWTTTLRTLSLQATFREQTLEQFLPFILHNRYIFESENIRAAYSLISQHDKALLPWDPERIDWNDYWIDHQIKGIEKWVQPEVVRDWAFKI